MDVFRIGFAAVVLAVMVGTVPAPSVHSRLDDPPMLLREHGLVDDLTDARRLIFDLRLDEAESALVALERRGGAAAALHHLSLIALLKGMLTDDPEDFDAFFRRSDALKRTLRAEPEGPWKLYLIAENELNRALAYTKRNRQMRAALAGRSAYDTYRILLRRYPNFEEGYKGAGVIELAIGTLPRGYQTVLRFLGFEGGVEAGLTKLHRAAYQSTFSREEAGIFLALLMAQVERSSNEPVQVLDSLRDRHPDSPLLAYLHGYMLLHYRQASQAAAVLESVAATSDRSIEIPYTHYYLGQANLAMDQYDRAARHYLEFLRRYDGPALRAQAYAGLGLALELDGQRERALTFYRQVDGSRGFDGDLAASREAEARMAAPLDEVTRTLILARNAFDSGRCEAAVSMLTGVMSRATSSIAHRSEAAYRLGRAYDCLGRYDEALAWYAQGALNGDFVEGRWAPWGHFYRGEILVRQGDHDRARGEYETAGSFNHAFDYRDALQQSVRAALDRLRRGT
jgi:tetratricopeptide (TPR) repeat protein